MAKFPTVKLEHVRQIHDLEAELVRLHLAIIGHPELWGAMRAADAALKECGLIAQRDIDQDEVAALRRERAAEVQQRQRAAERRRRPKPRSTGGRPVYKGKVLQHQKGR